VEHGTETYQWFLRPTGMEHEYEIYQLLCPTRMDHGTQTYDGFCILHASNMKLISEVSKQNFKINNEFVFLMYVF
jgi:hypothetical protein